VLALVTGALVCLSLALKSRAQEQADQAAAELVAQK
jgi:hypothetical protein